MTGVVPRQSILSVQTPQTFWTAALKDSHGRASAEGITEATDDAQLVANYGYKVVPIQGDARNMKITYAIVASTKVRVTVDALIGELPKFLRSDSDESVDSARHINPRCPPEPPVVESRL